MQPVINGTENGFTLFFRVAALGDVEIVWLLMLLLQD